MKKKILVLGGSGFVGGALVPALQHADCAVTLLNRGTRSVDGTGQISIDRYDAASMQAAADRFDVVIDTSSYDAAVTRIAYQAFGGKTTLWLHLSSAAVYRHIGATGALETDMRGGAEIWGDYGREKDQAEAALQSAAVSPFVILRPPYLYGPGNDNDRETFIWSRALSARPVVVPGKGDAVLQFLHVEDLASLFLHFVQNPPARPAIYNAAAPECISALDWARLLLRIAGRKVDLHMGGDVAPDQRPRDYFPFRDTHCAVDPAKLLAETGWRSRFNLESGFASTLKSYSPTDLINLSPTTDVERSIMSALQ